MSNIVQCEIERDAADNVNHLSVKELINYVVHTSIHPIHTCFLLNISTDYLSKIIKNTLAECEI
jgi:hypothetical protein